MINETSSEVEETLSSDGDFFVEDAPDEALAWSAAPQNLKPHHIITGNIYPND